MRTGGELADPPARHRLFMKVSIVMTLIGEDRPGLVDCLAGIIADAEGNWLESHMARLAGQFAGILRVEVEASRRADLIRALQQMEGKGLRLVVHAAEASHTPEPERLFHLKLVGHDRPGIVRQISRIIAGRGVNVEELATEIVSAPMTGEPLFQAEALLKVPASASLDELRRDLEAVSQDLMVDLELAPKGGSR